MIKIQCLLFFFIFPLYAYELSVAAIFHNEANRFKEWVEYHLMVGVEHFWLYDDASTDHWREILDPYIRSGIIEVYDWPVGDPIAYISRQVQAYRNVLEKAVGTTEWLAFIDLDEYLLPTVDATVTKCLSEHFSHASAIFVNWRHFGTGGIQLELGEPILNRLLSASDLSHPRNAYGKSIVRPSRIMHIWNPHHMVLGSTDTYCYGDAISIPNEFPDKADLKLDGLPHPGYLVINHYPMGDENYYLNVRVPRAKNWKIETWITDQLYEKYNLSYDFSMVDFLKTKHPKQYVEFWNLKRPGFELKLDAPTLPERLFQAADGCAVAWEKGMELFFSDLDIHSQDFQYFFFRTPPTPEEKSELTPITISNPNRNSFEKYRKRLLEFLAPHPKDKMTIYKKFYWLEDNPNTVGVYLSPDEDPTRMRQYLNHAVSFFGDDAIFLVCCKDLMFAKGCFPENTTDVYYIDRESDSFYIRVLNLCANNIIDSSSLAWWGAWLNPNPNKVVVCPNRGDLPPDWLQMHFPE